MYLSIRAVKFKFHKYNPIKEQLLSEPNKAINEESTKQTKIFVFRTFHTLEIIQ